MRVVVAVSSVSAVSALLLACGPTQAPGHPAPAEPSTANEPTPDEPNTVTPTTVADQMPEGTELELALEKAMPLADSGDTIEMTSFVIEEIAANPADPEAYPGGSGVVIGVRVSGLDISLSRLSEGYTSKTVAWAEQLRLELVSLDTNVPTARVRVHRVADEIDATVHTATEIEVRGVLTLDERTELQFLGHSHKSVSAGQRSPLIVIVAYVVDGQSIEETYNLFEDMSWTWRQFRFEIKSHDYGRSMVMDIVRRKLAPL